MFEKSHSAFESWYDNRVSSFRRLRVLFKKPLLKYRIFDVEILTQACIKFQALLFEQGSVDLFLEAITIASACTLDFLWMFTKEKISVL